MNNDELARTARYDLYGNIHRAMRAVMTDTLLRAGRVDPRDDEEVSGLVAQVAELTHLCALHVHDENTHVHAAIELASPGFSARVAHEHVEHLAEIEVLRSLAVRFEQTRQPCAAEALYAELASFVSENFEHMAIEETFHNRLLWARYTDEELAAIEQDIVAALGPQDMARFTRWLLPAIPHADRVTMLCDIRAHAPSHVFDGMLELADAHLPARERAKLHDALEQVAA